ncbi:hypothetical protein RV07_GL002596 [Enterococcus malodoratus]|nr:hypothetical protein RV07_GL002596 [Enterococcus malodoratus]
MLLHFYRNSYYFFVMDIANSSARLFINRENSSEGGTNEFKAFT